MCSLLHVFISIWFLVPAVTSCGESQYKNKDGRCIDCTVCDDDSEIVDKACSEEHDTVCQTLQTLFSSDWHGFKTFNGNKTAVMIKVETTGDDAQTTFEKNDTEQWKKLAFSLIGVLCVLVIVATGVVLFSCQSFVRFRQNKGNRHIVPEQEVEGDYVVIHCRRPSGYVPNYIEDQEQPPPNYNSPNIHVPMHPARLQHMRRLYRPQRRLLNEYVDDVFESEDSGGSRSGVRTHLHTIVEAPDSECNDGASAANPVSSDMQVDTDISQNMTDGIALYNGLKVGKFEQKNDFKSSNIPEDQGLT